MQSWNLKCFQHCDRTVNIMCFSVPDVCPICHQDTSTTPMRIPPFLMPSPFVASSQVPCGLVLKPTVGDFIGNYTNIADLHIGVTDSKGHCYDFDEAGLHLGSVWQQCIAVPMVTETDLRGGLTTSYWDHKLVNFADPKSWTLQRYHEMSCNCFDFVLHFLHFVGLEKRLGQKALSDKEIFCDEFLQKWTSKAAQFVNLYRRVLNDGYCINVIIK